MEKKLLKFYRILALICSIIFTFFLILAAFETYWDQEWYYLQQDFKEKLTLKAKSKQELQSAKNYLSQIRQIIVSELNITDRCISCHVGFDDPRMIDVESPLNAHSGEFLKDHSTEKFACTICHGGQGRALKKVAAHAQEDGIYWQYPLVPLTRISSYCGKCHLSLFETSSTLKNIKKIYKGLEIFKREGCLGCHKARGVGGNLGPDLSNQGAKSRRQYYYEYVVGEKTIVNWLKEHFIEPGKISPGSEMLKYVLPDDQTDALINFILGLFKPSYPLDYYPLAVLKEFKSQRNDVTGVEGFALFCAACHGKNGEGKEYKKHKTGIPTLSNPDFQSVASLDFLDFTLREGRSLRQMASWSPLRSGLYQTEIFRIVNFVRSWRKKSPVFSDVQRILGDLQLGEALYQEYCAFCHGTNGLGDLGPGINNENFLSLASNKFLYETLVNGRSNTAMPSWSRLSADSLASLIKYIRSWQKTAQLKTSHISIIGDAARGQELFHYLCTRCHGKSGQGGIGTAILNKDFLRSASDYFIVETVAQGRSHSAMLGWIQDLSDSERLSKQDINDIVAYMRSTEKKIYDIIFPGESLGNPLKGKNLFRDFCAECHGTTGEGIKAPALNNQEFLNAASNGYLLATITLGRSGTAMPSWGKNSDNHRNLSSEERLNIVAYIRRWQNLVITRSTIEELVSKN